MHQGRLRLRPWLEEQIRSGKYPGVTWLDETAGVFQIPWKHAARHGWNIDKDASLFRNWALHTGRYKPGVDKPDPKTWKANFRCALNSLPDVKELHDRSIKKGNNAFRVYVLLPSVKTAKRRKGPRILDPDLRYTGNGFFSDTVQSGVCPPLEYFPDTCCRYRDGESGYTEGVMCHRDIPLTGITADRTQDYFTVQSSVPSALNGNTHSPAGANEHTQAVLKIVEHLKNMENWSGSNDNTKNWNGSNDNIKNWSGFYSDGTDYSASFQNDHHMYSGQQRPYFYSH